MWFPDKEWVEKTSKILGLVGGTFTLVKTFFSWAADQSLERKIRNVTERIGESICRLRELDEPQPHIEDINVQVYASQLKDGLKEDLKGLETALNKKRRREEKRNAFPKGSRTWLLFYWPEGFDGWLVHSLFYGSVALLVAAGWAAVRDGKFSFSADFLVSAAAYFAIPLYLRWAARRLKAVAILKRIGNLGNINSDLGLLRRTLLLFKPASGWPLLIHIEYYFFVAGSLALPVLFLKASGPGTLSRSFFWEVSAILTTTFLLCARVLAADALAWRFLGAPSNSETSPTTTASADSVS